MPFSFMNLGADISLRQYKEEFKRLKENGNFSVNENDSAEATPLIITAAKRGFKYGIDAVLSEPDVNINLIDSQKATALHHACKSRRLDIIKSLLSSKTKMAKLPIANIELCDSDNNSPLDYLSDSHISHGTDPVGNPIPIATHINLEIRQQLFFQACETGRFDIIQKLENLGVNLNAAISDTDSRTALYIAVSHGHTAIVKFLLAKKVNKDTKHLGAQNTALHTAAAKAYPEIVKLLIEDSADPKSTNGDNQTPFMRVFEASNNYEDFKNIVDYFFTLPSNKFDAINDILTRKTIPIGSSYLHIAISNFTETIQSGKTEHPLSILLKVIPAGHEILNSQDNKKTTPLHLALGLNNCLSMIPALIKKGARLDIADINGMTAIEKTIHENDYTRLNLILENITEQQFINLIRTTKKQDGSTLIHKAATREGHVFLGDSDSILNLMLKKITDKNIASILVNEPDEDGNTPAHIALTRCKFRNFNILLNYGVQTDKKNKAGIVVSTLAEKYEKEIKENRQAVNKRIKELSQLSQTPSRKSFAGVSTGTPNRRISHSGEDSTQPRKLDLPRRGSVGDTSDETLTHIEDKESNGHNLFLLPTDVRQPTSENNFNELNEDTEQKSTNVVQPLQNFLINLKSMILNSTLIKHIERHKNKYLIAGALTYFTVFGGLCVLSVFFPPVAIALPVVGLIGKALGTIKFIHLSVSAITLLAKGITLALPVITPSIVTAILYPTRLMITGIAWICALGLPFIFNVPKKIFSHRSHNNQINSEPISIDQTNLTSESDSLSSLNAAEDTVNSDGHELLITSKSESCLDNWIKDCGHLLSYTKPLFCFFFAEENNSKEENNIGKQPSTKAEEHFQERPTL